MRAFLMLSKQECDEMTIEDYLFYRVMLKEVIKIKESITLPRIS
jgi:hypothetical protein